MGDYSDREAGYVPLIPIGKREPNSIVWREPPELVVDPGVSF